MYFDIVLVYYHQTRKQRRTPTPNREHRTQQNQQWEEVGAIRSVARVARCNRPVMGLPCWSVCLFLGGGEDKPAMGLPCWLIVSTNNITKRDYGPYLGVTSRGSPTLAIAALSITLLKPILWYICLCGSSWGPNPLDEEAAVKSAIFFFPLVWPITL